MKLNELRPPEGSRKKKKRIGRGEGSGHGGTSTKGHKGYKARSGGGPSPGYEGGQMPLQRRLPKRGFKNPFREEFNIINVRDLARFPAGSTVDLAAMLETGMVKQVRFGVKVLGEGEISHPLVVRAHRFSSGARAKIEGAGGKAEVI